jgi:hypothetical protein
MSRITDAWEQHPGRNLDGALTLHTRGGTATIGHLEDGPDDGTVLVWTGPHVGRPQLRLGGIPDDGDPIEYIARLLAATGEGGTR